MYQQLISELEKLPPNITAMELNMTNMLLFPENLLSLLTWMIRLKVVHPSTVAEHIQATEEQAGELLDALVKRGLIEEAETDEGKQYQVNVRSSRNYRVPDRIWKVFDE